MKNTPGAYQIQLLRLKKSNVSPLSLPLTLLCPSRRGHLAVGQRTRTPHKLNVCVHVCVCVKGNSAGDREISDKAKRIRQNGKFCVAAQQNLKSMQANDTARGQCQKEQQCYKERERVRMRVRAQVRKRHWPLASHLLHSLTRTLSPKS